VPPHLLEQWQAETRKFLGNEIRMHVIQGLKPYQLPEADVYLIHYLVFRGWEDTLRQFSWQAIVMDEVQELPHLVLTT
jgi:SWI/SNF-related matrix-associated actin-dependent regulator of chromatin subfamily A-like protein 1